MGFLVLRSSSGGGGGGSSLQLTWAAPTQNNDDSTASISGYNLYAGSSLGSLAFVTSVGPSPLSYTFTGLTSGTYYFAVKAVFGGVEGDMSEFVTGTVP